MPAKADSTTTETDEAFFKAVRFMGELTITAEKVGAGKEFFAFLTHDEKWFGRVARLVNHLAILKKHEFELKTIDRTKIAPIIAWVQNVLGSDCFFDEGWETRAGSAVNAVGKELQFMNELETRILSIGIHPAEIELFEPNIVWTSNGKLRNRRVRPQGCDAGDLEKALLGIVAHRNALKAMSIV